MNPHEIPPLRLVGSLCLEELRKPDQRIDSVPDSLHLPLIAGEALTEKSIGDGCEAPPVFLHQSHQPDWSLLSDVPHTLPDPLAFLKELEELNPPDLDDLSRERNNGLGLQGDPGEAAHQSILVTRGQPATAPAEGGATGTNHVIAAVPFLPGSLTAGAGPDLDLSLQAGVVPHHPAEGVEGVDVPAGGGVVVGETTDSTECEATDTGNTPGHTWCSGHAATPGPGTLVNPRV